jgi:hypothetical protein
VLARLVLLSAAPLGLAVFAVVRWAGSRSVTPDAAEPLVEVWEFLIAASVVLWTALASVGLRMLETLPRRGGVWSVVVAGQQWKNVLLHAVAAAAITPWLVALKRIQLVAADDRDWAIGGDAIERLRALRGNLKGATAALGGMVALAVILSGALREAVTAAGLDPTPDSYVLVYGAWLTAIVAAIYLHVFGAIERRARWILKDVPVPHPASAAFPAAVERRAQLAQELELGGDPRANLEGLVAVLAPLIGALLTRVGGL